MLTISKFSYKNIESKIRLHHPFEKGIMPKLRKVIGFGYSATHKSWYASYSNTAFSQLKQIEPKLIILRPKVSQPKISDPEEKQRVQLNAIMTIDRNQNKIQVTFNQDDKIKSKLYEIENNYRISNYPKWFFAGTNNNYLQIKKILKQDNYKLKIVYKKDKDEQQNNPIVKSYVQAMIMRNNSKNTINIYLPFFKKFVDNYKDKNISELTYSEINSYIQNEIKIKQLSQQQKEQLISAIKYYYEKIRGRNKMYFYYTKNTIIDPKIEISIPEIIEICEIVEDFKAKLLIIFHYSLSLSFEEISKLTLKQAKKILKNVFKNYPNSKDVILEYVKNYYEKHKPQEYFFEIEEGKNHESKKIQFYIYKIIGKHKLADIYKKEYISICKQAKLGSGSTKNYLSYFLSYLKKFNFVHPLTIKNDEIRAFLIKLNKGDYSKNTINQYINVIKLYYEKAHKREISNKYIFRPKRPNKLPDILSMSEIQKLFSQIKNLKHHCLLILTYSGGLRRSETINLRTKDIDFERNQILIRSGKGNKDRVTLLSENLKKELYKYIEEYNPKKYLFEGATGGKYSFASFSKVLKKAVLKSEIQKNITIHSLRHSFATHLLEQGTDIRYIQKLLGHKNIKTTLLYTHVAKKEIRKIKSPLDNINL